MLDGPDQGTRAIRRTEKLRESSPVERPRGVAVKFEELVVSFANNLLERCRERLVFVLNEGSCLHDYLGARFIDNAEKAKHVDDVRFVLRCDTKLS